MAKKQLTITINPDGTLAVDASQMSSSTDQEILELLEELAADLGGEPKALKVEQHVHRHGHTHVTTKGKVHTHR